jgi:hypothetical protein
MATTKDYHGRQVAKDYGARGDIQSSQGGFTGSGMSGGASGAADYSTTNAGKVGDCDSTGSSGY